MCTTVICTVIKEEYSYQCTLGCQQRPHQCTAVSSSKMMLPWSHLLSFSAGKKLSHHQMTCFSILQSCKCFFINSFQQKFEIRPTLDFFVFG